MADNAKWYVVHTYSGYENAVKTAIEKFVANRHLEDMILDIQIPMETVTEVTESGAVKEVERKTFPGYVMVKMVMTDDTWHLIRNIRGVTGFVGSATNAIPLTEDEVLALGMERREIVVAYNVGDQVKITDGPWPLSSARSRRSSRRRTACAWSFPCLAAKRPSSSSSIRSKWSKDKQESPEAMSRYPGKVGETLCVSPRAARLRGGRYHIYNQGGA